MARSCFLQVGGGGWWGASARGASPCCCCYCRDIAFDGGDGDGEGDDDSYLDDSWSRVFYLRLCLTGSAIFSCLDSY